jgi:hypothetical protein
MDESGQSQSYLSVDGLCVVCAKARWLVFLFGTDQKVQRKLLDISTYQTKLTGSLGYLAIHLMDTIQTLHTQLQSPLQVLVIFIILVH